ncbi:MAG: two-component regulator propeller domain-containing protein, partial [Verrucomicrobiota bacterium]
IFRRLMLSGLSPQEPSAGTLLAVRDGSCWVAGAHGLLHFKNPLLAEQEGGEAALTNLSVNALAEDDDGGVWAGTRKGELWHFSDAKWLACTNCPQGHAITAIVCDRKGKLWVGTEGDGLYQAGPDGRFEKVGGLSSGWIRTLFLDGGGTLWIGTTGGGLSRLQNGNIATNTYTMREGLLDNTISQILEDDEGNLWLGGDRGIIRVKKRDLDDLSGHKILAVYPQIYGRTDGMLSEECASGFFPAGLRTKAGLLYFPTLKGVVMVDSHHLLNSPAPPVVLEQSLVDGVPGTPVLARSGRNGVTGTADDFIESLRLDPGKHTVEFRYTGLSFDAPERVRFRYRLDPLDPEWVEAGTRRVAFYSFVPPGIYHFRVIACNGDGVWNQAGASLELKVLPHFWQTWWFIGGGILGVSVLGTGSIRVMEKRRVRRRLKFLEQERALERERTRIAQDLHDIMGAKLCRISFLSEQARRRESVPEELREEIRSMSDDSREVLRSLDEIVWAVNPQKDTLDHLASYIGQYAQEYFSKTGIEYQLEVPGQLPVRPLSSQTRHHLFLAVHEALTNILKHSGATRAKITMICRPAEFEIEVSDNGNGFDPLSSEGNTPGSAAGFCNGLGNMRRRLTDVGGHFLLKSQAGQGTTVRFILSFTGTVK